MDQIEQERRQYRVPGHVVHTARAFAWAAQSPRQQRRFIRQAKKLFPGRNLAVGRGNRFSVVS